MSREPSYRRGSRALVPGTLIFLLALCASVVAPVSSLASSPCPNQNVREEQGTEMLPECRAYELISAFPAAVRNGAEIFPASQRVQAADDGGAFKFSLTSSAGDIESVQATIDYVAVRNPEGRWSVHGVTAPQPSLSLIDLFRARQPRYLGELSPDLSRGVFLANAPLNAEGPNVREASNLYLRDDLLSPGPGSYRLLTDADSLQPHDREMPAPVFAGASSDFSHVLFESRRNLTAGAAGLGVGPRLYEWVNGAVRLEGILPASEGGLATVSQAGQGAQQYFSAHTISQDGSRAVFTAPPFGPEETGGNLYVRDDRQTGDPLDDVTLRINGSEKTNGAGPGGTDPNGSQSATFWDATGDLGQVYFTSTEALTDQAQVETPPASKLYRYTIDAAAGHHLTLLSVDQNPADGTSDEADGAIGASRDGSFVYFVGSNQLVAGGPTAVRPRIFVWHDGAIHQVAGINGGAELSGILGSSGWWEATKRSRVTADGRHLIFVSEGTDELTGYDQGSDCPAQASTKCQEVYLYEADADGGPGQLQCASCNPTGQKATADAELSPPSNGDFILLGGSHLNRPLTSDGRQVFFTTAEPLSPVDANTEPDVYSFDSETGAVGLISSGKAGSDGSHFLEASPDGHSVFFATRDRLLARDRDQSLDVYGARVDGGATEPPPPPPPCSSEVGCRPASVAPVEEAVPASSAYGRRLRDRHPPKGARRRHARKHHGHRRGSASKRSGGRHD